LLTAFVGPLAPYRTCYCCVFVRAAGATHACTCDIVRQRQPRAFLSPPHGVADATPRDVALPYDVTHAVVPRRPARDAVAYLARRLLCRPPKTTHTFPRRSVVCWTAGGRWVRAAPTPSCCHHAGVPPTWLRAYCRAVAHFCERAERRSSRVKRIHSI